MLQSGSQLLLHRAGLMRNAPSEEQLWSYLTQLASALRVVHCAGLAVRTGSLMPSKVLLTSHATGRIRIGERWPHRGTTSRE